jgi:hypothetical protein
MSTDQNMRARLFIILFGILLCGAGLADTGFQKQEGQNLVAVYASGGSLETDYGLITDDIRQMAVGAGNTTPDNLEVLVAFGGSKKPGWEGMTIANISSLTADLADGTFGNKTSGMVSFPGANMGSADAMGSFLSWIHSHYQYNRVFLILIGHGEAYTGMLFDQNHGNDPLTLSELTRALQIGGYNVDLIGFDTCLMSSLETATRVTGYARYMVASEESEPAEGWRYDRFIADVAARPNASTEEIAGTVLESYLDNPVPGKTLSLLSLDQTGVVTADLDRLAENMQPLLTTPGGPEMLSGVFNNTQQFGITANGTLDPATMDLCDLAENLKNVDPSLSEPADTLLGSLQGMIIRSVHDDADFRAKGLAILSPLQISSPFYTYYLSEASVTPSWDQFMAGYLELMDAKKRTDSDPVSGQR